MSLLSVPKVSAGSIQKVIFSPEVIAIASATIIAPMIEPHINSFLARVPILSGHPTLALIIFSVVFLLIASKVKGSTFRAILIGVAGANFLIAIIPAVRGVVKGVAK